MESSLCLMSKIDSMNNLKLKKHSSTKQNTPQAKNSPIISKQGGNLQSATSDTIKLMQKQIENIEKQQNNMKDKCQKIIQQLMRQIQTRDKKNQELEMQIADLRQEVKTSQEDLQVIVSYLSKKKIQQMKVLRTRPQRLDKTGVLDSTKDSGRLEKSITGLKVLTKVSSGSRIQQDKVKINSNLRGTKLRRNKSDIFDL